MPLTSAQLKGRIKSLASKNNADARNLCGFMQWNAFWKGFPFRSIMTISSSRAEFL